MDFKQIQELVKMVNKSNISELSIEQDKFKITIKQKDNETQQVFTMPVGTQMQAVAQPVPQVAVSAEAPKAEAVKADNLVTIKSPMIGTFYRSPGPDKPSFVNVGDDVSVGKVVCIIEAMKLFNEIESEVSGKIVKILVDDASPVEYDQPLYLVEP
jgi:acetyl-CoA carboxylase biotin carboxyl carrier protein